MSLRCLRRAVREGGPVVFLIVLCAVIGALFLGRGAVIGVAFFAAGVAALATFLLLGVRRRTPCG